MDFGAITKGKKLKNQSEAYFENRLFLLSITSKFYLKNLYFQILIGFTIA